MLTVAINTLYDSVCGCSSTAIVYLKIKSELRQAKTPGQFSWQPLNHSPEGAHFPQKPTSVVQPTCYLLGPQNYPSKDSTAAERSSCQLREPHRHTTNRKVQSCKGFCSCLINTFCSTKGTVMTKMLHLPFKLNISERNQSYICSMSLIDVNIFISS